MQPKVEDLVFVWAYQSTISISINDYTPVRDDLQQVSQTYKSRVSKMSFANGEVLRASSSRL